MKRTTALLAITLALLAAPARAGDLTNTDIARLPQDKVAAIVRHCAREWDDNFRMRKYCEDTQYKALQDLIARGSVRAKDD
jgi:hypothetical protein